MKIFTIGFTQKTAEEFFGLLKGAGVRHLIDTRLNNRSQLAGFSKAEDLRYFLREIARISYRHAPEMAPTQELLDSYKKQRGAWRDYELAFNRLIEERALVSHVEREELVDACLLCSEHEPKHCHRRLVAEYFQRHIPGLKIVHLS